MKAYCLIRPQPWYRREAFVAGLKAAGLAVQSGRPDKIDAGTVLVIWNRYADNDALACQVERGGGRVLVAENGYLGAGGGTPKFQVHPGGPQPGHYYALAESWHNGGGRWPAGGPERWERLGIELKPWRTEGEHILVCPNRSFGVPGTMMPPDWAERTCRRLQQQTKRPIRLRPHPGNDAPRRPLANDLAGAWAMVMWSSTAGVHALVAGIPVICDAPAWICKDVAYENLSVVEALDNLGDDETRFRRKCFERLAWAQWTVEEIASGEPFRRLLVDRPGPAAA